MNKTIREFPFKDEPPSGGIVDELPIDGIKDRLPIDGIPGEKEPKHPHGGIIIDTFPLRPTLDPFPTKPTIQPKPKYPKGKALLSQAMELARLGNLSELKEFIEQHRGKFDINGTDEQGRNLAHYAAMSGHPGTLQFLNKAGVDMTATDNEGNTIAHVAVEKVESMKVPYVSFENSQFISEYRPVSFMEAIAFSGVDVTQPNNAGKTPLDIIAPVNNEGIRMVPSRPVLGIYGEGVTSDGRTFPVTSYSPDRGALDLAHYLAKQENDNRPISYKSSDLDDWNERLSKTNWSEHFYDEANSSGSFNSNGVNKTVNNSLKNILSAGGEAVSTDEQVIDDAFKAIQRGSNNER